MSTIRELTLVNIYYMWNVFCQHPLYVKYFFLHFPPRFDNVYPVPGDICWCPPYASLFWSMSTMFWQCQPYVMWYLSWSTMYWQCVSWLLSMLTIRELTFVNIYYMWVDICHCVPCVDNIYHMWVQICQSQTYVSWLVSSSMGWLRLVGSLKWSVSFAKEPNKKDDILQKRPVILRSLQVAATPYHNFDNVENMWGHIYIYICRL